MSLLSGFTASIQKGTKLPKRGKTGPKSVPGHDTQHGELDANKVAVKAPQIHDKIREDAEHERRMAVQNWVAGRIPTHEHAAVHSRANYAIKNARKIGRGQLSEIQGRMSSAKAPKGHPMRKSNEKNLKSAEPSTKKPRA